MKITFFYISIAFVLTCLLQSQLDFICLTGLPFLITFFYFLFNSKASSNLCLPFSTCNSPKMKRIADGFSRGILIIYKCF